MKDRTSEIAINSKYNEGKWVVAERIIGILKNKIYKKMAVNNEKSYLRYFNNLADEYSNSFHHSMVKNLLMLIILLWLKKLKEILNYLNLKLVMESEFLSTRIFLAKVTQEIWSREIFVIGSVLSTNPWIYKIKDLNKEKIIGSFCEKELLLSKL